MQKLFLPKQPEKQEFDYILPNVNQPRNQTNTSNTTAITNNDSFVDSLLKNIKQNDYFNAGLGILSVGAIATIANRINRSLYQIVKKNIFTSLEITINDNAYYWIMEYIMKNGIVSRHHSLRTNISKDKSGSKGESVSFSFLPSIGSHFLWYDKKLIFVERSREKNMATEGGRSGIPFENIKLSTFIWYKHLFEKILKDAKIDADKKEEGKTIVFKSFGHEWRTFGEPKNKRPITSVILRENMMNYLIDDINKFLHSSDWYISKGIPYRRCYLLHGPPGCGKSSLISALAGYFDFHLCTINVSDCYLTDDRFIHLLATIPPKTILILEDIDGVFAQLEEVRDVANSHLQGKEKPTHRKHPMHSVIKTMGISYSGLLNALDGIVATDERIIFMTTNHFDKLPKTLIRPGRVDVKIAVSYANEYQLKNMFLRFFPNCESLADQFVNTFKEFQLSMAEIQSFFLFSKEDPVKTVQNAKDWVQSYKNQKQQTSEPNI